MTTIYLTEKEFNIIKCTGDIDYLGCLEGVLLDNELIEINNVMYAAYEHPINANSSDLLVSIATTEQEKQALLSNFNLFKKMYINDRIWDYIHYSRYSFHNIFKRDVFTGERIYDPVLTSKNFEDFYNDCIETLEYYCDDKEECNRYINEYITNNESKYY